MDWETCPVKGTYQTFLPFRPTGLCHNYSTLLLSCESSYGPTEQNCVPIKLYSWKLKFQSHIVFTCHKIPYLFRFFFLNHLKKWKAFLVHGLYTKDSGARLGHRVLLCNPDVNTGPWPCLAPGIAIQVLTSRRGWKVLLNHSLATESRPTSAPEPV